MNKHVQIRNLPPDLHQRLKQRALARSQTLSDYLREELERIAMLPTLQEWVQMARRQPPVDVSAEEVVEAIREGREENDRKFEGRDGLPAK